MRRNKASRGGGPLFPFVRLLFFITRELVSNWCTYYLVSAGEGRPTIQHFGANSNTQNISWLFWQTCFWRGTIKVSKIILRNPSFAERLITINIQTILESKKEKHKKNLYKMPEKWLLKPRLPLQTPTHLKPRFPFQTPTHNSRQTYSKLYLRYS